jgi:polar amino acid transport system substrate-binding protein
VPVNKCEDDELSKKMFFVLALNLIITAKVFAFNVAVDATYAPFAFEEDGVYKGFEVDIARAIEKEIGETANIQNIEYTGSLVGISVGKIDMIVTVDAEDIKKDRVFLTEPIMSCGVSIVANKDRKDIKTLSIGGNTDELKSILEGKKIGVITGTLPAYETEEWVKDGLIKEEQIIYFDDLPVMYISLKLNKIDLAVNDAVVNSYYEKRSKEHNLKIVSNEFNDSPGQMAITKKNPKLYEKIVKALEKLEENGELENIRKKWDFHK